MAYQNILVPVDGSETSYAAVAQAAELAKAFGGKITVVQVLALDPYIAAEYISANQTILDNNQVFSSLRSPALFPHQNQNHTSKARECPVFAVGS